MSDHPTRGELERLSVDDLPAPRATAARDHVAGCAECTSALDELERSRVSYFAAHPPGRFMEQVAERKARTRFFRWPFFVLAPSLAVAAIALFVTLRPTDGTRFKGGGIDVLRRRGEAVGQLGPDDRISAGDELGFVLVRSRDGQVAAWAVDATGRVDPLTNGAISLGAGDQRLPQSAVVEAPCRDLTLIATDDPTWLAATPDALRRAALDDTPPPALNMRKLRCK